jgi:hypothetical protein
MDYYSATISVAVISPIHLYTSACHRKVRPSSAPARSWRNGGRALRHDIYRVPFFCCATLSAAVPLCFINHSRATQTRRYHVQTKRECQAAPRQPNARSEIEPGTQKSPLGHPKPRKWPPRQDNTSGSKGGEEPAATSARDDPNDSRGPSHELAEAGLRKGQRRGKDIGGEVPSPGVGRNENVVTNGAQN